MAERVDEVIGLLHRLQLQVEAKGDLNGSQVAHLEEAKSHLIASLEAGGTPSAGGEKLTGGMLISLEAMKAWVQGEPEMAEGYLRGMCRYDVQEVENTLARSLISSKRPKYRKLVREDRRGKPHTRKPRSSYRMLRRRDRQH